MSNKDFPEGLKEFSFALFGCCVVILLAIVIFLGKTDSVPFGVLVGFFIFLVIRYVRRSFIKRRE